MENDVFEPEMNDTDGALCGSVRLKETPDKPGVTDFISVVYSHEDGGWRIVI